jgi:hypothetical protein
MRTLIKATYLAVGLSVSGLSYAAEPLPAPNGPIVLTVSGKIERANEAGIVPFGNDLQHAHCVWQLNKLHVG